MNHAGFRRSSPAIFLVLVVGCGPIIWAREDRHRPELGDAQSNPLAGSAAVRDTIGALAYYDGLRPMRVRGYGVVVGLGNNGSEDCPPKIFNELVQTMSKQRRVTGRAVGVKDITPERLLRDVDTAVVMVQGEIPPAAVTGSRCDVFVMALPGTQTKSLRGGRLFTTDLRVHRDVASGASIPGRVLARAAGPLFLNPFSGDESATKSNPLQATILGGGIVTEDRRVRLVLMNPSHVWARRIRDRINAHFPGPEITADAVSPSFVRIRVPREYYEDEAHFLALVKSLYVSRDPRFEATRARELADELVQMSAPHALIALAFEGLGRSALPVLGNLYAHPKGYVSFHAGVAGLRLGDHIAGDAVARHAQDPASEFRFQAIRALGEAKSMAGTAIALRNLLLDEDPRVQTAAYEALAERNDTSIESTPIGGDNFILARVATSPLDFVYVKRSDSREIVLFGDDLKCTPPALYRAEDGSLTITASEGDSTMTVLRVVVPSGTTSPLIPAPFELWPLLRLLGSDAGVDLDDDVTGLGLDYAAIVRALYHLSRDGSLNAKFILQQPNAAELFGPPQPAGRPESEL